STAGSAGTPPPAASRRGSGACRPGWPAIPWCRWAFVVSCAGSEPHCSPAQGRWGTRLMPSMGFGGDGFFGRLRLQQSLQRFQTVSLAWRLVPAQPADARKSHRHAGFVPRRARQPLERDFQHQPLFRFMNDMADRAEFLGGVAPDKTVDLQQLLVGEAEIGL